ncbi:hypothetical protein SKAU_G00134290, partial [Synaphobranchus kaupii]
LKGREVPAVHVFPPSTFLKKKVSDDLQLSVAQEIRQAFRESSFSCHQLSPTFRQVKMPETAEEFSSNLTTNRNCTVEITNVSSTFCLINPKVYMNSGYTFNPPQPTVRTTMTEVCSFSKKEDTASGSVGVLTYELFDMQKRHCNELIAVMFSVPFDYNFYKNWLGVGIFEHTRTCDEDLYKHMYYDKDMTNFTRAESTGSGLEYKGRVVDLRASMSNVGRSIIKLEVFDKM